MSDHTSAASADASSTKLHPTLFVGLGGTGKEVLLRLRRRILQADWNGARIDRIADFPVAGFLYFDIDTREAKESNQRENDPLAAAVAFDADETLQRHLNAETLVREIRTRHPLISEWWPEADIAKIDVSQGAGQIRCISRLGFFDNFSAFNQAALQKGTRLLQNVDNQSLLARLGLDITTRKLRIVVIASTAGGTGSGSFIDVGYMLRSRPGDAPPEVDLYLVLPGAFRNENQDRVYANSFASLMELEHAMRPGREPPYVERWTPFDRPRVEKPYNDVYLIDTVNLAGQRTGNRDDIFGMIADILFEDFGSGDFADSKRSVAVNQENFKNGMFFPVLPESVGGSVLGFARGFSAVGQATLDTRGQVDVAIATARATQTMLARFFGIDTVTDASNVPTSQERDEFLAAYLALRPAVFDQYPDEDRQPAVQEFEIVTELLRRPDGQVLDLVQEGEIEQQVAAIKASHGDYRDWPKALNDYRTALRSDIDGSIDQPSGQGTLGREINHAHRRLRDKWIGANGDIRPALYRRLDNKERGGLDYTVRLIGDVRDQIGDGSNGIIRKLADAERRYQELAAHVMNNRFDQQLQNLRDASKGGWFVSNKQAFAETYIVRAQAELQRYLRYRVRARACNEAQLLLAAVSRYLGRHQVNAEGVQINTGIVGEFLDGRADVVATSEAVGTEIATLEDAARRQDATYLVANGDGAEGLQTFARSHAASWSEEAFSGYNGSQELFPRLREKGGRLAVLNLVRRTAQQFLAQYQSEIPPVIDVLGAMQTRERDRLLERLVHRAMPWLDAGFERMRSEFSGDQFKVFVAVRNAEAFRDRYEADIRRFLPTELRINSVNFVESALPGRMIIYCELSGIPLDSIRPLRTDWSLSYQRVTEDKAAPPLHNHRDIARFPMPLVPTDEELEATRTSMRLLLQAICFGILIRRSNLGSSVDGDQYTLEHQRGDRDQVGTERVIRSRGFESHHRDPLRQRVAQFESKLEPVQLLAAAALFDYTANRVYAPPKIRLTSGAERRESGMVAVIARQLKEYYRARYDRVQRDPAIRDPDATIEAMKLHIADWTDEIAGSLEDVDGSEVNKDPEDTLNGAVSKRVVNLTFQANALRNRFAVPPRQTEEQAYDQSASRYYVWADKAEGPYGIDELRKQIAGGRIQRDTKVARAGGTSWISANEDDVLGKLFDGVPSAEPPPPPPPPPQA